MNASRTTFVLCVLVSHAASPAALPPPPTAATEALLDANPGLKLMVDGYHVRTLFGVPFAVDAPGNTNTDLFVSNWLNANKDSLGVDEVVLVENTTCTTLDNRFIVYKYTQEIESLPKGQEGTGTVAVFRVRRPRQLVTVPIILIPAGTSCANAVRGIAKRIYHDLFIII